LLGEYLGRVFEQTKGRPTYLVRETSLTVSGTSNERREVPELKKGEGTAVPTVHRTDV
jgi:hypothetical protein